IGMGGNFVCSLNVNELHAKVVVKLYVNKHVSGENNQTTRCHSEAAEAVMFTLLHLKSIAPNLLGVFDGGIVVDFIQGRNLMHKDFQNLKLIEAFGRKLAMFHSIKMPIRKTPAFIPLMLSNYSRSKIEKKFCHLPDKQQLIIAKMNNFPSMSELQWVLHIANKISMKVFSHNDLWLMNAMIKDEGENLFEKLYIIDYESCDYNYRG
ncbi:choline/ethanolamine kinase-like isoform X2, partial [Leptotrombidium deliense]